MRLHTNQLDASGLRAALITTGLDKKGVWLEVCEPRGSRTHKRAFDVRLAAERRPGRRWANSGKHGSGPNSPAGFYVPTYDEWGYWLAEVFRWDPTAKAGQYADAFDFHRQTEHFYMQQDGLPAPFVLSTTGG